MCLMQVPDLRTWLETTLVTLSVRSDTARAINYALNQWQALTRYVDDGRLEAENNAAERALRAVALGRLRATARGVTRYTPSP